MVLIQEVGNLVPAILNLVGFPQYPISQPRIPKIAVAMGCMTVV